MVSWSSAEGATHKYLGRKCPGDLQTRAQVALISRLQMAWSKYAQLKPSLTNRHVNLRVRLRLFDTVVSPTVLYGLETTPLTSKHYYRLDVTMRKMLRNIVGWVHESSETCEEVGRRMKSRLANAMRLHSMTDWSERVLDKKAATQSRINDGTAPALTRDAANWCPVQCKQLNAAIPKRSVGRPRTRWNAGTLQ